MKTIKFAVACLGIIAFSVSCNNNPDPQKPSNGTITKLVDSSKEIADSTKGSAETISAMFVEFSFGDVSHYLFKDKTGREWDFASNKDKAYTFGIELPAKQVNETNQGWGSNKALQGKWFELTYEYVEQPEYQDGPMAKVPIITKAVLKQ